MTPFGESHRYQEQIGAFLLGKLDAGELEAMQAHLDSCPGCQAEVRELEPVVAGLADAVPDRIDEDPRPPGDLEESTLAPILGEIQRAQSRRRRFGWPAVAAAAIFVVLMGLAGFTWLAGPGVALEKLSFSDVPPDVKVEGKLIAYDGRTEINLDVSGLQDCQTYEVTLVSKEERVDIGTFIGTGDKSVSHTFKSKLAREGVTRLEIRTPDGELEFFANLPEEPQVENRDKPRWADAGPENDNKRVECGHERPKGPSPKEKPPADRQEKPKEDGFGGGTPDKESDEGKGSSAGGEKSGAEPEESEPGRDQPPSSPPPSVPPSPLPSVPPDPPPDPCEVPPNERPPTCPQYEPQL